MKLLKMILKKIFCKHSKVCVFFPKDVYFADKKFHGLKLTVCFQCEKIVGIEDYAK